MTQPEPQSLYLDYNATAPLLPSARWAMERVLDEIGNASSQHRFGRRARAQIEEARAAVAELACAEPSQVTFTSGGTEANNLALWGSFPSIWISSGEHESVAQMATQETRGPQKALQQESQQESQQDGQSGAGQTAPYFLPITPAGVLCLDSLADLLKQAEATGTVPRLVSVQAANNETGVLQPLEEILSLLEPLGVALHIDAAQYLGRLPCSEAIARASLVSISGHKFGGAQGAGALIIRDPELFVPILRGGGQESRRRAGTENVAAIAAFGAAAAESLNGWPNYSRLANLRDDLERRCAAAAAEAGIGFKIAGAESPRLANTSCFALDGGEATLHLAALDLAGVAVSSGSACSSGRVAPSGVLLAMGWSESEARGALRVSFGWATADDTPVRFAEIWRETCLAPLVRRKVVRSARAEATAQGATA